MIRLYGNDHCNSERERDSSRILSLPGWDVKCARHTEKSHAESPSAEAPRKIRIVARKELVNRAVSKDLSFPGPACPGYLRIATTFGCRAMRTTHLFSAPAMMERPHGIDHEYRLWLALTRHPRVDNLAAGLFDKGDKGKHVQSCQSIGTNVVRLERPSVCPVE